MTRDRGCSLGWAEPVSVPVGGVPWPQPAATIAEAVTAVTAGI